MPETRCGLLILVKDQSRKEGIPPYGIIQQDSLLPQSRQNDTLKIHYYLSRFA